MNLILCGCGALGSRIVLDVASYFERVFIIDDDIVEQSNIGTSAFWHEDLGVLKANVIASKVWRRYRTPVFAYTTTLNSQIDSKYQVDPARTVVIDTFDNPRARMLTVWYGWTLHVGVGEVGNGSVIWGNRDWSLQIDFERGNNPTCTNRLGHQVLQFTSSVAVGSIIAFIRDGRRDSYIVREDMSVVRV
jgi:hypothetical protein